MPEQIATTTATPEYLSSVTTVEGATYSTPTIGQSLDYKTEPVHD